MEPTPTKFSLNHELAKWQETMLNGALTNDDVVELAQHLVDEVTELKKNALNDEEAWLVARHRIGQPLVIDAEFNKVNPDFTANRNWLMLFWGATLFMLMQTLLFVSPGILQFIVRSRHPGEKLSSILTEEPLRLILYIFSGIMLGLVAVNINRASKISAWFNQTLAKHSGIVSVILIITGSFAATYNYKTISHLLVYPAANRAFIFTDAIDLLGVTFYGSLIFCTAWFTMRYRKQEFRNIKAFSTEINWAMCLTIGIMLELMVSFTNTFQLPILSCLLTVPLFSLAGWMIGY